MTATPCFRTHNGQEYPLDRDGNFRIGSQNADILLTGASIVPEHAMATRVRDRVMIKPVGGVVSVNGQPLTRSTPIQTGDVVTIGDVRLEVTVRGASSPAASVPAASSTPPRSSSPSGLGSVVRSPGSAFQLDEAMFDEPVETTPSTQPASQLPPTPPAIQPSTQPATQPTTQPVTHDDDDRFVRGMQGGITAPQAKPKPGASTRPSSIQPSQPRNPAKSPTAPRVNDPSNLTDDECRTVLQAYFNGSQIYKENKGGGIELNFGQRWSRTRGTFGRSWVLATEGLKLGAKALEWLSNMEDRNERPAAYVDAAIKQSINKCIDVAYDRLMMQPTLTDEPLVIYGPIFWREAGLPLEHICARKGDDGFVRFSAQQVSILVLDTDQIGIFICALDTITGRIGTHKTRSYNYKDIVSIADEDTTVEVEMQEGTNKINVYAFNIEVSSGRNLSITLNSQTIRDLFDGDAVEQPEHQQTVNVIRQMWRTKKNT